MQISKSEYMMFLRHPAWLWLKKFDKTKLPPIDEDTQARFDAGHDFEVYAEQLFAGATRVPWDHSSFRGYQDLTANTKAVIDGGAKTIFQARFEAGQITCICDVIVNVGENTFDLYEIKSATSVKPEHELDLAFQVEVIEGAGYKVGKVFVVYVNNQFVKNGEIKATEFVLTTEVTENVKELKGFTKENIINALAVLARKECPSISPRHAKLGYYNEWLNIYKTIVSVGDYSIYHLGSPGADKIGQLEDLGVKKIIDIPENFKLDEKQLNQVLATKNNAPLIDKAKIRNFLSQLQFPLYFLDYETLSSAVPYFDKLGPYKQLPFQYSLHKLVAIDAQLEHFEYLHKDNSNPVYALSKNLMAQIGDKGTILVWYEKFEKGCNELMGTVAPEFSSFYNNINSRIIDLMEPFASGFYVDKDFFTSASIKNVLPVVVPDLSYKNLDINAGGLAQRLWMQVVLENKNQEEKEKIFNDLIKYCELDTLAMVRIYKFLANLVNEKPAPMARATLFD